MPDPFPFRLGATSFVHHPAGLVESVQRLAGHAGDVELILWDSPDGGCNFPDQAEAAALRHLVGAHNMTLTVHLPLDVPGTAAMQQAQRVMAARLQPWAYVFHLRTEGAGSAEWGAQAAITQLKAWADAPLALENLESYDPALLEPIFAQTAVGRTVDVGHLWKQGRDPLPVLARWLPHARVIHLHGFDGLTDHLPLDVMPPSALDPIIRALLGFTGVLTLEVFRWDEFERSRTALLNAFNRIGGS